MSGAIDEFIDEARSISLDRALEIVGAVVKGSGTEKVGPCPVCGGRDRFSVNFKKGLWFCRQGDRGGDALALIAYRSGYDLARRAGLLAAASELLGRPVPDGAETETEDEREARARRLAVMAAKREADRRRAERQANAFREREIERARGIYFAAGNVLGTEGELYLCERAGVPGRLPEGVAANIRFSDSVTLWHGEDKDGNPRSVHVGPCLLSPIVTLDGRVVGCHQTWVDMSSPIKFRPVVNDGNKAVPTKKMRGRKKGGIIPVFGDPADVRWIIGEGIETVLAVAVAEGFPAGTFYAAAGDIGNLSGPADPARPVIVPDVKKPDKRGRLMPLRVPGIEPAPDLDPAECVQIPQWVGHLVILVDGDSELYFTAAAITRAVTRLERPGLTINQVCPPEQTDFADITVEARKLVRYVA